MHPHQHAANSARVFGGRPEDYLSIHMWLDDTKTHFADFRHRALRHHSLGVGMAEEKFGTMFQNSDGKTVYTRNIAIQHIKEDCGGRVPTVADWLRSIQPQSWMTLGYSVEEVQDTLQEEAPPVESAYVTPLKEAPEIPRTTSGEVPKSLRKHAGDIAQLQDAMRANKIAVLELSITGSSDEGWAELMEYGMEDGTVLSPHVTFPQIENIYRVKVTEEGGNVSFVREGLAVSQSIDWFARNLATSLLDSVEYAWEREEGGQGFIRIRQDSVQIHLEKNTMVVDVADASDTYPCSYTLEGVPFPEVPAEVAASSTAEPLTFEFIEGTEEEDSEDDDRHLEEGSRITSSSASPSDIDALVQSGSPTIVRHLVTNTPPSDSGYQISSSGAVSTKNLLEEVGLCGGVSLFEQVFVFRVYAPQLDTIAELRRALLHVLEIDGIGVHRAGMTENPVEVYAGRAAPMLAFAESMLGVEPETFCRYWMVGLENIFRKESNGVPTEHLLEEARVARDAALAALEAVEGRVAEDGGNEDARRLLLRVLEMKHQAAENRLEVLEVLWSVDAVKEPEPVC